MNHEDLKIAELVRRIEEITKTEQPGRAQKALGVALWRTVTQHPTFFQTREFSVNEVRVREGGHAIRVDIDVLPAKRLDDPGDG